MGNYMLLSAIYLTDAVVQKANELYKNSPQYQIRQRMHFILLKSKGHTNKMISDVLDVTEKTIYNWLSVLKTGVFEHFLTQVKEFMNKNKLIRRKVGQIPAKADIEAQESFVKQKLNRLITLAKSFRIRLFLLMQLLRFIFKIYE